MIEEHAKKEIMAREEAMYKERELRDREIDRMSALIYIEQIRQQTLAKHKKIMEQERLK